MDDLYEGDQPQSGASSFDFKHLFSKLLSNYLWILLALGLSIAGAYLYLRYSTTQYQISGYILVGGAELETGANDILANAGIINAETKHEAAIDNEIFILQSHKINGEVVDSLKLDISVIRPGSFKSLPLLKDSLPITIQVNKSNLNTTSDVYELKLQNNKYTISGEDKEYTGAYGSPIIINKDTIIIERKAGENLDNKVYSLQFMSRLNTIKKYLSRLKIEPAKNGGTGLLKISVTDEIPDRSNKYIDVLIHSYNVSYLDYKNQAIKRALNFLNERLKTVSTELTQQENQVRDFKANNQLYDVSATATELLSGLQTLDVQKGTNSFQENLLNLVETSMKRPSGQEEIVASSSGLQDPILTAQVTAYNELVFKKQMIQNTGTSEDPRLEPLNDQLKDIKRSILANIENIKKQFKVGENYVASQENKIAGKFQTLPEKEKQFVELSRKLTIKETQYIFLLQKKEETELQMVSGDGDRSRSVDDILNEGVVSPKTSIIYGVAFLLGLLIPCSIIGLKFILNQKIETRNEIENGTTVPILGELGLSMSPDPIVISENNRTVIAEQLRAIRTNLSFMSADEKQQVFIITSTMSGEGKSFLSLNLANSMAISNKKVAVLELDLRKPMLSRKLGLNNHIGISNFLVKKDILPSEITQPIDNYPNLYLLNSGPIPPNPGELMISPRMEELITYLKANFDYVILDLPPIGLVSDALSMARYADISLFVIRPNHSLRSSLRLVNNLHLEKKFPKLSIVVNGIDPQKGYGYGYGYGYGNSYYAEDEAKKETYFQKLLKKIK
jgi:tyrosine-protein kinase Etk/Wzc